MRLLLMGAPGAGKGTQAAILSARLGIPAISTGDIFRENSALGTPLGVEAQSYMDRGAYVPDELTNALIADRLARTDTDGGFLLDGYPRTTDQADYLDQLLAQRGQVLERVVNFRVDHEELIGRLLQRAIEQGRRDDTEAVIRRRQEVYAEETAPLLASYANRGILITIDGSGEVEDVARRALDALAASAETSPESDLHATPRRGGS